MTLAALETLQAHAWPGNVRELVHEVRKLVLLCPHRQAIDEGLLPEAIRRPPAPDADEGPLHLDTLEKQAVARALERSGGNQVQAAHLLGISRFALRRRMERYAFDLSD